MSKLNAELMGDPGGVGYAAMATAGEILSVGEVNMRPANGAG